MSEHSRRVNIDPHVDPDGPGFAREITTTRNNAIDDNAGPQGTSCTISVEVSVKDCKCKQRKPSMMAEGFTIRSTEQPDILGVQFYDQCFCTTPAALAASWAGKSMLIRHGYLLKVFQFGYRHHEKPFCLLVDKGEYLIGGSLCSDSTKPSVPQLEECWEGGILLAQMQGGWSRFFEHVKNQSRMLLYRSLGRHISRMIWRPCYASSRQGSVTRAETVV